MNISNSPKPLMYFIEQALYELSENLDDGNELMKSEKVRLILEMVDKSLSLMRVRPKKISVYKADYKILRESMSSEKQRIYPNYYPHSDVEVVPFSR